MLLYAMDFTHILGTDLQQHGHTDERLSPELECYEFIAPSKWTQ